MIPRFDVAMKLKTITVNRREGTVSEQSDKTTEPTIDAAANEAATSPTNDMRRSRLKARSPLGIHKVGRSTCTASRSALRTRRDQAHRYRQDGEQWSDHAPPLHGYIRGSGKDKDHVDVFIGPEAEREQPRVFVVDPD